MEKARDPLRLSSWLWGKRGESELGFPGGGDLAAENTGPLEVSRAAAGGTYSMHCRQVKLKDIGCCLAIVI